MLDNLTVVTPVKETDSLLSWYNKMGWLLGEVHWVVVDSGGGQELKELADVYIKETVPFYEARKLAYNHVTTPYTLNLDCFTLLPKEYIQQALMLLQEDKADCCAIDYTPSLGHYGFGTSIWKTVVLKQQYDAVPKPLRHNIKEGTGVYYVFERNFCECSQMWNKLVTTGHKFVPLFFHAVNEGKQHG